MTIKDERIFLFALIVVVLFFVFFRHKAQPADFAKPGLTKPATRKQYGALNYNEGGTPDYFGDYETYLRAGADDFNVGSIYETNTPQGGAMHNGILYWPGQYLGVLRNSLRPVGITPGQNYHWGKQETAIGYGGAAPLNLQPQLQKKAPWLS